jgi:hypothetical protein
MTKIDRIFLFPLQSKPRLSLVRDQRMEVAENPKKSKHLLLNLKVMSTISSKIQFLIKYVNIPPEMWDFIIPHGPVMHSQAIKEYAMAGVVRDISKQIPDKELAERVKSAGGAMAKYASQNLLNGWEDGDDICPPWFHFPIHFPRPFPEPDPYPWFINNLSELNPQPLPPRHLSSALKVLAGLTSLQDVGEQLKDLGNKLKDNI